MSASRSKTERALWRDSCHSQTENKILFSVFALPVTTVSSKCIFFELEYIKSPTVISETQLRESIFCLRNRNNQKLSNLKSSWSFTGQTRMEGVIEFHGRDRASLLFLADMLSHLLGEIVGCIRNVLFSGSNLSGSPQLNGWAAGFKSYPVVCPTPASCCEFAEWEWKSI